MIQAGTPELPQGLKGAGGMEWQTSTPGTPQASDSKARRETPGKGMDDRRQS